MTRSSILTALALGSAIAVAGSMLTGCFVPSDRSMARHFEDNRRTFDEFAASIAPVLAQSPERQPHTFLPLGLFAGDARVRQILGCREVFLRENGAVVCAYAAAGLLTDGEYKNYVYSAVPLHPIVRDFRGVDEGETAYKELGGGWYIEHYFYI